MYEKTTNDIGLPSKFYLISEKKPLEWWNDISCNINVFVNLWKYAVGCVFILEKIPNSMWMMYPLYWN